MDRLALQLYPNAIFSNLTTLGIKLEGSETDLSFADGHNKFPRRSDVYAASACNSVIRVTLIYWGRKSPELD